MKVYAVMDLGRYGNVIKGTFLCKQNAEEYIKEITQSDDYYLGLFISEFLLPDA